VIRLAVGVFGTSGNCPATELIFTKPENSSEAASVALPQTAVAIVLQRFCGRAFGFLRFLHILPEFANRAMATARNGRVRRIPLVQRLSFGMRSAAGWTVAATVAQQHSAFGVPEFLHACSRNFANRAMATALYGRARRIPLVRSLSFGMRSASSWTVATTGRQPFVSDYIGSGSCPTATEDDAPELIDAPTAQAGNSPL
jgi:hypothetical protein